MVEVDRAKVTLPGHLLRIFDHFRLFVVLAVLIGFREHVL
jgi:hypothetical protein